MKKTSLSRYLLITATCLAAAPAALLAQEWQVIDTFEGGVAQGTWTTTAQPTIRTDEGWLDLLQTEGQNTTASHRVDLPQSFTSGKMTLAFDFYLPSGPDQNQVGFGAGSDAQGAQGSWNAPGARNRFQAVSTIPNPDGGGSLPQPQNVARAGLWTSDIFGTTEQGVWYNVWLVYDLDASPNTVTTFTKKASQEMIPENLNEQTFEFDDRSDDDWSSMDMFALGIGLGDHTPEGSEPWDVLGGLWDNFYVSADQNVTEKPTSISVDWTKVDTFAGGAPEATWTVDAALAPSFEGDSLLVTGTAANAGMYTALPIDSLRSSFTVTFDLLLPGGAGANDIQFAVVGDEQIAQTGAALFGGNDRFVTQPGQDPQPLARFGQWPSIGGPDLLGGTVEDQWYHIWIVYDGSDSTMEFYSVPVSDPVESVTLPAEPAGSFEMATSYTGLGYFVIGTGFLANGNGVKIDNLYQSLGTNVTLSPTAGDFGSGGNGDPVSPWADLPDIGNGFKSSGIGIINDEHYPYVWHFQTGGYFYIADEYSDLTSIWGMDLSNDFWFWTQDELGGWYFNVTNPASGDMGWSAWTK